MRRNMKWIALPALLLALSTTGASFRAADPPVRVILWFDTEDYMLPASDDAARRVAEILTTRGIRGTFKVVGEKARVLERRSRTDVIDALRKHDIGYHSNFHSVHPTPAEYLAGTGWHDGIAEFIRREGPGADDVRRVFGVTRLSTYGQPGSSWAAQTIAALPRIGIADAAGVPTYVDEGSHVGLDEEPFWYTGALHVFHMRRNATRMELHEAGGLERGTAEFKAAYDRLRAQGGGIISIYYHPCEWVHQEFWDAVNFRRGANPPREAWKAPPQRPAAETDAAYARFEQYIDYQRALPGVSFITASDLSSLYHDRIRTEGATVPQIAGVARGVASSAALDRLQDASGRWLSPADQLALVTSFVAEAIRTGKRPTQTAARALLGPREPAPPSTAATLPWPAFRDALLDLDDELRAHGHVPSRVFVGVRPVAPADFTRAVATVALRLAEAHTDTAAFPDTVDVPSGTTLATERYVADDTPGLFGGWVIHTEGFRAPRIVELAKLQAWTLKPVDRR
jgi:hypothetical protein